MAIELVPEEHRGLQPGAAAALGLPASDVSGEPVNVWDESANRWLGQGEFKVGPGMAGKRCSEMTIRGYRCPLWAMQGTTVCHHHAGRARRLEAHSARDYAALIGGDEKLRRVYETFYLDPDICDCRAELALQRTMLASILAKIEASGRVDGALDKIPVEAIAAVTEMTQAVTKLALAVDAIMSKNPNSLTLPQVEWLVEQLVTGLADALLEELPDDGAGRDDRSPEQVRGAVLSRVADAVEDVVLPPSRRGTSTRGLLCG